MALKNMEYGDDQDFDPEFAEFAAAKRALKPQSALHPPSKYSSVITALEKLPGFGKNGEAAAAFRCSSCSAFAPERKAPLHIGLL